MTCLGCKRWILYVLLFYLQYRPVQTDAPATGAANIGGLNFSCLFEKAEIQIPVNKYECPQRLSLSSGNLFGGSFTNHNTGNYLRHGINITTNERLSPTFRGKGNTIIVGDSQTSPLPILPDGGGTSVHRLICVNPFFFRPASYSRLTQKSYNLRIKLRLTILANSSQKC